MANLNGIPKPSRIGDPPLANASAGNLEKPSPSGNVPLQLKLPPEIRRDFRSFALAHDLDANKLFLKVWAYYKENHG
jgi:hypothetical protein